ncbi:uncharacterized protein [Halyomorpha halys]|uniref:uncharacterized protein n=1 Tax=Halyomorpha halys TaxID=286706 RepID=UPI0006D51768|nr:uncharacterized protein LOC106691510 [Halyomorpha halys]
MMAKILLPLLLIVSAVAGDDINDLCTQLTTQFNLLQKLMPLDVNVMFPRGGSQYITGPAKYRLVSELTLPDNGCSSVQVSGTTKKQITIKLQNERTFVISPLRIYTIYGATYTLKLDVELSPAGDSKKVSVADFTFETQRVIENTSDLSLTAKVYVTNNLKDSLKKHLEQTLTTTFQGTERVEISSKLVRDLMVNVFQVTAQDL